MSRQEIIWACKKVNGYELQLLNGMCAKELIFSDSSIFFEQENFAGKGWGSGDGARAESGGRV